MSEELIEQQEEQYSASNIQVLEGLEAVRKRPSMYIGDTHVKGLHHLVSEVVDNSIDEALAGFCDKVTVTIGEDNSITVSDNGRGIPVDEHEKLHKSALEVVMTVLHAGGKFDKGSYKVSGGLHGVGVSCVNALSDYLRAEVRREGKVYMQEYAFGKPTSEVKIIGECAEEDHGTTVIFHPDATIFQTTVYQFSILSNRLRDLAYLNAEKFFNCLGNFNLVSVFGNLECVFLVSNAHHAVFSDDWLDDDYYKRGIEPLQKAYEQLVALKKQYMEETENEKG